MCGSCAMTVNGRARWTCRTHVEAVAGDGRLEIAPLANLPVIRDLVTDMREFFDKWARAKGQFVPTATRSDEFATVAPASKERLAVDAAIECIGCGVCYASCDVVGWNRDYLGPAALNRAWTLVNDVRDGAQRRAARRGRRRRRLPCLPHASELHRPLPEGPRADRLDRRSQAQDGARGARPEPSIRERRARPSRSCGSRSGRAPAVLALCVVVHLVTMIVAVRGGLTGAEILGRTRGSVVWAAFYGVFVVAVAIHAPIGVRTIVAEMRGRPRARH